MPTTTGHPRIHLHLTEAELRVWLSSAAPGDWLEYHRGFLALDRALGSRLGEVDRKELDRVAERAMALAQAGRGHLVQRRHGAGDCSYLFVVASAPARNADLRISVPEDVA